VSWNGWMLTSGGITVGLLVMPIILLVYFSVVFEL
jgi:hypothetical protein